MAGTVRPSIPGGGSPNAVYDINGDGSGGYAQTVNIVGTDITIDNVTTVNSGDTTDNSGTIASGGVSQELFASNSGRKWLLIQNLGLVGGSANNASLWVNFTSAASAGAGSYQVQAGGSFEMDCSFVTIEQVNIVGPTTGQTFTAKQG
jgi:hypothetical protein